MQTSKPFPAKITSLVVCAFYFVFMACNGSGTDKSKAGSTKTTKQPFDTAAFLKARNMALSTFSIIPDNQTQVITGSSFYFPTLVMGNNSKLIISPSVPSCDIIIDNGTFGDNTEIVADGPNGVNGGPNPGDPWSRGWWQASQSNDGDKGVRGIPGTGGANGISLNIAMGIVSLHTLSIHSKGGNGGNSGNGGNGEVGGGKNPGKFIPNNLKHSGNGGPGGDGPEGGAGGSGGTIKLQIFAASPDINLPTVSQGITLFADKGIGGHGGTGGAGGARGGDDRGDGPPGASSKNGDDGFLGQTSLKPYPNRDSTLAHH